MFVSIEIHNVMKTSLSYVKITKILLKLDNTIVYNFLIDLLNKLL